MCLFWCYIGNLAWELQNANGLFSSVIHIYTWVTWMLIAALHLRLAALTHSINAQQRSSKLGNKYNLCYKSTDLKI